MKQEQFDIIYSFLHRIHGHRKYGWPLKFNTYVGPTGCTGGCHDIYCKSSLCNGMYEKLLATGKTNGCIEI